MSAGGLTPEARAPLREDVRVKPQRRLARLGLIVLACLAAGGCGGGARAGRPLALGNPERLPAPGSSHVVEIVMENAEYGEVIGNRSAPYINGLARRYGLATASYAITHPSLPNYIALTSGTTGGLESDCTSCTVDAPNIVDQLEAAGISWKAYLEDLPTPCFKGASFAGYAKKHNPFAYYPDVAGDGARCAHLVGFAALARNLRNGRLPTYAWISPNLCDDGHDCALGTADRFLAELRSRPAGGAGAARVPDPDLGRGLKRPRLLRRRAGRADRDDRGGTRCPPGRAGVCAGGSLRHPRDHRAGPRAGAAGGRRGAGGRQPGRTVQAPAAAALSGQGGAA